MNAPRVLIVRFSSMGDVVMAVPVASRLRRAYPDAFVAWAVEDRFQDLISAPRLVDHIAALPWREWKKRRWTPNGLFAPVRAYLKLREHRFDYGIDLQGHSKTAICLRLSGARRRIAARSTDPLAGRLNPILPPEMRQGHAVEVNLATLDSLGLVGSADPSPIMPPLTEERAGVAALAGDDRSLVTINVGAGHPSKLYPLDRWEEAARGLLPTYRVAILGGPGDPRPNVPGALDLVGKLSLREAMAWVAESSVHLAADTGTGHIAAAYGVPVVTVFGGPFRPEEFRPYTDRGTVLHRGADASRIEPEEVLQAARAFLNCEAPCGS